MLMQNLLSTVLFASAALAAPLSHIKRQDSTGEALSIDDIIAELELRGYIVKQPTDDATSTMMDTPTATADSTSTEISLVTATGEPSAMPSAMPSGEPTSEPDDTTTPAPGGAGQTVVYIGQRKGESEHNLMEVCQNENVDIVMLSFMHKLKGSNGLPASDMYALCSDMLEGTDLSACPDFPEAIKTCQDGGKKVMLSIGGATMEEGIESDDEAKELAKQVWDLYGGGSGDKRPYGDVKLDGFDLDIENKKPEGWVAFAKEMRSLFATDSSKEYFLTAAPQCPRPDMSLKDAVFEVDYLFIQFYNNEVCHGEKIPESYKGWSEEVAGHAGSQVKKIFVGLPASEKSAGSGYMKADMFPSVIEQVKGDALYGGLMTWDYVDGVENPDGDFLPALRANA